MVAGPSPITHTVWAPTGSLLALVSGPHLYTARAPDWAASLARVGPPTGGPSRPGAGHLTYSTRVWGPGHPGVWWSPGAGALAYSVFPCQEEGGCDRLIRAGESLPRVALKVTTLEGGTTTLVVLPAMDSSYLSSVAWASSSSLLLSLVSRNQSTSSLLSCSSPHFSCSPLLSLPTATGPLLALAPPPLLSPEHLVTLAPVRVGREGAFNHVLQVSLSYSPTWPSCPR